MKAKLEKVSEDLVKGAGNSLPLPTDLIIDLFSRLPAKTVARCRCLSKLWASRLGLPYFTELYLTRSSARPRLLFACYNDVGEVCLFSSPHPQNLDDDENSSLLTTTYHMKFRNQFDRSFSHAIGLVLFRDDWFVSKMYNPSTGQTMTLPKLKMKSGIGVKSFLGYDPVQKQYKVLYMTWKRYNHQKLDKPQLLTLGTGQLSWRRIECCEPHSPYNERIYRPYSEHIYTNGVLYYLAQSKNSGFMIVCFDFKSEKFSFIKDFIKDVDSFDITRQGLINYNGKLGVLIPLWCDYLSGTTKGIKLQVLEDVEKQEWSSHTYVLPDVWQNTFGNQSLRFRGMIGTNEIVLSPSMYQQSVPFYVFYYNTEKETMKRVGIHGLEAFPAMIVEIYLDHVEDVKLLQMF